MAIKNIAGQPVQGENFFDHPALVREFQQKSVAAAVSIPVLKMWWWKNVAF